MPETVSENLLRWLARRYSNHNAPFEDLLQEAHIAAWQAEQSYKPERGASLRTYAINKVKWALLEYLRLNPPPPVISYDALQDPENLPALRTRDFAPMLIEALCPEPERKPDYSPAQLNILRLLTQEALPAASAAYRLGIQRSSISEAMYRLYKQWGVKTLLQAYNEAMRRGLIDPPERNENAMLETKGLADIPVK